MSNIAGKVIVITGASSGLGEASARLLASNGAVVVLGARRFEKIESLARQIIEDGGQAVAVRTDVSLREDVSRLVETACRTFGKIDVIINNAGIMPLSLIEQLKVDEWEQMIDINLKGVLYGIAAALPYMKAARSGHIINVASTAGHRVDSTTAVYSATKYAVRALSEGIRQEVTPYNIRTTIISPGASATGLLAGISDTELQSTISNFTADFALSADTFARMVLFAIGQPEEVDVNEILFRPTRQKN
ncbi:short-chain dehydrogenase/reductase SDR [Klebsiella pneumoniae]|uniref:SDR family oxidoreductase n=1 Tax=Klebsiella pneumoniae TaxID=573 RepID=UPI0006500710|nr:SDR family oxidoreductase [Klebsiella pneumoniae]HBX3661990.1 SDR family oxidoreductase [Klebsiella pneumoniae subsp. pneumoniae]EKQ7190406.1 SDR family oxidoreductase [Klebsiella pneumoniae]EKQ7217691.1 SDR family oxidoreductase [Klebsiella pneumoniae]EKZ6417584.1 SDR family oxidoreductase [Klebsiella pneumoniae]EKZ6427290.1 SDR family oxidoreductase [Klebsiella pneumoniae]